MLTSHALWLGDVSKQNGIPVALSRQVLSCQRWSQFAFVLDMAMVVHVVLVDQWRFVLRLS
eukprot:654067-Amphidinium_carterae.1